jgi:hypothetical protein
MALAAQGRLNYGRTKDVFVSTIADLVLELRFTQRVQYPKGKRAVRLYFSELDCNEGELLAAHMAAKPATATGLDVQDDQMKEAQLRIERHLGL